MFVMLNGSKGRKLVFNAQWKEGRKVKRGNLVVMLSGRKAGRKLVFNVQWKKGRKLFF